jgi:hypothetical protein
MMMADPEEPEEYKPIKKGIPSHWPVRADEDEFQHCSECDGHDACADFGCAIKAGLGHLVNKPL